MNQSSQYKNQIAHANDEDQHEGVDVDAKGGENGGMSTFKKSKSAWDRDNVGNVGNGAGEEGLEKGEVYSHESSDQIMFQ